MPTKGLLEPKPLAIYYFVSWLHEFNTLFCYSLCTNIWYLTMALDAPGRNYPPLKHLKLQVKYTFPVYKLQGIRYFYRDKKPGDTFSST